MCFIKSSDPRAERRRNKAKETKKRVKERRSRDVDNKKIKYSEGLASLLGNESGTNEIRS